MRGSADDSIVINVRVRVDDREFADDAVDIDNGPGENGCAGTQNDGRRYKRASAANRRHLKTERQKSIPYPFTKRIPAKRAESVDEALGPQAFQLVIGADHRNPSAMPRRRIHVSAPDDVPARKTQAVHYDFRVAPRANEDDGAAAAQFRHL